MGYDLVNPYSLLFIGNAVFSLVLALVVATRFRGNSAARGLSGMLVGVGIWSLADAIRLGAESAAAVVFWNRLTYLGVVLVPPAFLVFVAAYVGRDRWLRRDALAGLGAISALALATVLTNPWHGLWRTGETVMAGTPPPVLVEELGVVHLLWNVYVLVVVVPLGLWMLASELRAASATALYRRQVALIAAGVVVPIGASALFSLRVVRFDVTPLGFATTGLAMTVAISRYRLFDVVPIARDTVLEHIDSGVLVVDDGDRIVDANPQALDILDRTRSSVVGQFFDDLVADIEGVPDRVAAASRLQETIQVPDDATVRHYDVHISPVADPARSVTGRVVLFADVTEQVSRQRRLEAQKERLETQNERLDEFAGLVTHDLRNPLQVIDANLQLIEADGDEERLEAIREATRRMEEIVDQVLTLARTGEAVDETEPVALASVVRGSWDALGTDGARLEVDLERTVSADRARLRQCFENLFRNAVEHGGDDVTVTVGSLPDGFYVADDGPGFPAAALAAEDGVVDYYRNGGHYGLQIVAGIVEAHDWDLTVENGAEGGARFEIRTAR